MKKNVAGKSLRVNNVIAPVIVLLLSVAVLTSCESENKEIITYSLYPYLLDSDYYRSVVEGEWSRIEPDIELKFVDYDCYYDGAPEGIDVIMYDSCLLDEFTEEGYLQAIDDSDIDDIDDFFDYTLNDNCVDGRLYGIPAILCSEYLIYDEENVTAENAKCIEDMAPDKDNFLLNVDYNYSALYVDYLADSTGTYDPDNQTAETDYRALDYLKASCNENYLDNTTYELAEFYRDGKCDAFLGYSETLSLVGNRLEETAVKPISLTDNDNIPLYFSDMVGMSTNVKDSKREDCLKLMNLISSTEVMAQAAVKDDTPSYLIFPRKSVYDDIINEYPFYETLYEYANNPDNRISR